MVEKIRAVKNPLTIIAIFAGLAEVSGTIALVALDVKLQSVFIWFVILFPSMLVVLFFITLNFNAKVLYSPGDFKDEKNFITTMSKNDVNKIEVNRENIENIEIYNGSKGDSSTRLPKPKETLSSVGSDKAEDKQLIQNANLFFRHFVSLMQEEYIQKELKGYSFEMQSDEIYLLSINFDQKEGDNANTVRKFNFIIRIFRDEKNKINLEVIGWKSEKMEDKGITESPEYLANYIAKYITNVIHEITYFRK